MEALGDAEPLMKGTLVSGMTLGTGSGTPPQRPRGEPEVVPKGLSGLEVESQMIYPGATSA
jgi:hypothetical protein